MELHEVFVQLGEEKLRELVRSISIGKLKTYRTYDQFKTRARLVKLNTEHLRKSAPRLYVRLSEHDEELAKDLAQAILVSHLEMLQAVLDFLKIPHEDGFFAKDSDSSSELGQGWQDRVWNEFHTKYPESVLQLYINHLGWELAGQEKLYVPAT